MSDIGYGGLDYGVRRAAYSAPAQNIFEEIKLSGTEEPAVDLLVMSEWLCDILCSTQPTIVAVEESIQGSSRNVRVGLSMAKVAGVFAVEVRKHGSDVIYVPPARWKKVVTGRGHADKTEVATWLSAAYPQYTDKCRGSQDLVDATCIALYAQTLLAGQS